MGGPESVSRADNTFRDACRANPRVGARALLSILDNKRLRPRTGALVCPAWALTCCLQGNNRRGWTQPKWNRKAATVRDRLKEAESEVLTVGTRTGDEAGGGR